MSANVESMFSVRETPWHGLGTIVQEAPTSADALHLAGLDWDVVQKSIQVCGGSKIKDYKANVRSTDGAVLGIVGNKYKVVQNKEAFDFTDSLIEGEVRYETAGSLKGGKTIWLLAKLPEQKILDDKFDPYICFSNTHDGTGAIKVCMTPIRVVCNNTLNVALSNASRMWTTRHMGDMQSKLSEAQKALELAGIYMEELNKEADKLANESLTDFEIRGMIHQLFPLDEDMSDRQKNNIEANRLSLIQCYNAEDIKKFKNTKWGFLNAVSDFVGHNTPNRMTETYQTNNWGKIMTGHPIFDEAYNMVTKVG